MGFFSSLFSAAVSAVATVINIAVDVASAVIDAISEEYKNAKEKYKDVDIDGLKKRRFEQLVEVNNEIIDLDRKNRIDGRLSDDDQLRLDALNVERRDLRKRIDAAKEYEVATDMAEHSSDYDINLVDPNNPNELTRLGGQVVMGKLCASCNRPMTIRWRTDVRNPVITDLFWGCTGFFIRGDDNKPICKKTMNFTQQEMRLFGHIGKPGMELPAENLNKIVLKPETSSHIKGKLKEAVYEVTEDYLCPVHHEKMSLRTKSEAVDILDLYFLKCSRCDQMVKIKSATQLDAVLESFNGSGLFSS